MLIAAAVRHRLDLYSYYRQSAGCSFGADTGERSAATLDLATVAFNNALVVHHQARLLRKYLRDSYAYTVFDNSPPGAQRQAIRDVCTSGRISYVELPRGPFAGNPSMDHGAALNWVCRRHFASRSPAYFGFIDHDIFPYRPTSIVDRLEGSPMYGRVDERDERWYLWPGFCFFSRAAVRAERLDFLPAPGLDTGGGNWAKLYRKADRSRLPPLETTLENLRDGTDKQADMVERIGDWLHTINASEWKDSKGKMPLVAKLLGEL